MRFSDLCPRLKLSSSGRITNDSFDYDVSDDIHVVNLKGAVIIVFG